MRRLVLALCLLLLHVGPLRAEDDPASETPRIAWFRSLPAARKVAAETGRPIFVAVHVRPRVASPQATARTMRWLEAYRAEGVVALSRECACVLRIIQASEGADPDVDRGAPAATHYVMKPSGRVLARLVADVPPTTDVIVRLLRRGLRMHGPIDAAAPRIDARRVAADAPNAPGASPMKPAPLPAEAPGVRLHLRTELPAPVFGGGDSDEARARVSFRFDGEGPFALRDIEFRTGTLVDEPLEIRFADHTGLSELITEGLHRLDVYVEPAPGTYRFTLAPLHVARLWIQVGDGGGGGGGSSEQPQPEPKEEEKDEEQPDPNPDGVLDPPELKPDEAQDDVIDPFVGEGETVKKDDAVVAVEDDDAGVKPPAQMPLDKALRDFEKEREAAIRDDGISARERAFLRRYFELLEKHAAPAKPAKDGTKARK